MITNVERDLEETGLFQSGVHADGFKLRFISCKVYTTYKSTMIVDDGMERTCNRSSSVLGIFPSLIHQGVDGRMESKWTLGRQAGGCGVDSPGSG
jgi:hypothetical protein